MKLAIYPGTFDPVTYGHLDVLKRACQLFDEVLVGVAPSSATKTPLFTLKERLALLAAHVRAIPNARVERLDGLTVNFARAKGAVAIIRGLRAVSDFEYEFQMAQMNRHLDEGIETIFLMPSQQFFYTSSHLVKQVCRVDATRLGKFVPPNVLAALKKKYARK